VFLLDKPLQPSLVFVGKAEAYPKVDNLKCTPPGYAPGLSYKHLIKLE